ncbi:MAG: RluA family pseudouridine synthase [Candidatus Omnitrophica bacterium]|jgi:23S rRNA pseudouridine1911/1915/1917 synthase|nr:RluA family pseudouridine synthase [Candidatus Omnitrophota bacterium]MDD5078803.1 RluA family pseudouridine synthase [Candidatus Omnitrophota bacterium]
MQEYNLTVQPEDAGKRLDIFLLDFFLGEKLGLSRTAVKSLIDSGCVILSGEPAKKAHQKVKAGDVYLVAIEEKKPSSVCAEDIPLEVVYEDNDLAVINKPGGLVVHPAPGNREHTLVNALMHRFKSLSDINPERAGIVHRLDKETSGLLVIAKNNVSHLGLAKQFAEHSIKRRYVALVKGKMEFEENVIELPIARDPQRREAMAVNYGKNSRYARTRYRALKRTKEYSFLELEPFTGRTHQLRVHLSYVGHPILGDRKYGRNNEFPRLALHARVLGFVHPVSGKSLEFSCAIPVEFTELIEKKEVIKKKA